MFATLRHHLTVLRDSWRQESQRRKTSKSYAEVDFLPAALEIQEKPPSPVGRAVLWCILLLFTVAVLWACFGRVDVVATAQGRLIPRERVKVIQPAEIGVVRAIHVRDGEAVHAGDVLIELDPTISGADELSARQRVLVAEVALARARALLAYIEDTAAPRFVIPGHDLPPGVAATQQRLIDTRIREFEATIETLHERRHEQQADLRGVERERAKLSQTLPILKERIAARRELMEKGLSPRLLFLELRERQITMEKDLEIAAEQQAGALAGIAATEQRIAQTREEFRRGVLAELAEAQSNRALAVQELTKAAQRKTMQTLVAPIDGVVQQLAVHTVGGVVQSAEPVMVIVPGAGEIVAETYVLNKDIGFVHEGDPVEVKLEAFPFTKFGVIEGRLEDLSGDAVENEDHGFVYQGRISLARQTIRVGDRDLRLVPGMTLTAEIKTGQRRLIEFLISPLLRYRDEALREQ